METSFQINNDPKKRTLIKKGFKLFANQDCKAALRLFSDALFLDKDDLSAKIGLLLSDMAMDFPKEAYGFYELYETMLAAQPRAARTKIQRQILELINSFDSNIDKMSTMVSNEDNIEAENIDGILYPDFKKICQNDNFKEVFENLIFSTKIIFTSKNDFYDFLDLLVENDFYEMSLSYIENMPSVAIYDEKIRQILQKAVDKTK
ncbi:histidine kinase [Helicobacter sp. 13S00482-2]|uniref:histidine kinase n=1 Tax=Helicobacter sp. 13S00482-2 TaxID=1476200 RepID=UPI000BA76CFF|nr:histidine kinase [Helicobacter sp. 13S00482-2]PAF53000.1 histidine kinase [Helicobacter sp. 13S00482-2]